MAAAKCAMADGALDASSVDSKRFGVLVGSGVGGLDAVEESCRNRMNFACEPIRVLLYIQSFPLAGYFSRKGRNASPHSCYHQLLATQLAP